MEKGELGPTMRGPVMVTPARRFSGLTSLSELEWFIALRGPTLFLVFLFHGLSSINFAVLGTLEWTATPYESRCFQMYYPKICGIIYGLVALLHLSPFVRPFMPSLPNQVHALKHITVKPPWWYICLSSLSIPPHVGPVLVRSIRVLGQTWIAYDMASNLVNTKAARVYAMILVSNCLSTSWMVLLKYTGLQKTMLYFLQSFLAFLLSSGFPLFAFVVPIIQYRVSGSGNEAHDLKWLGQTMSATRFLVISEPYQLVLNVGLSVLNYIGLQRVASRLNHTRKQGSGISKASTSRQRTNMLNSSGNWSLSRRSIVRTTSARFSDGIHSIASGIHQLQVDHEHKRFLRMVLVLDLTWSLLVFIASISSQVFRETCPANCVFETYPWLTHTCNCIYVRFDCNASYQAIDANVSLLGSNLLFIHTRHCLLEDGFPSQKLAPFNKLYGLTLEYTNMIDWDMDSSELPSSLKLLQIRYSNLTRVPRVLENPRPTLNTLIIVGANIGDVPSEIFASWSNLCSLWLSQTNVSQVPTDISDFDCLETFALDSNHISVIPDSLQHLPNLSYLYLDNNNITEFPVQLIQSKPSLVIYLNRNPIEEIPSQYYRQLGIHLDVASTPFCSKNAANVNSQACITECSDQCTRPHWGNLFCDLSCNTTKCDYDKGDCLLNS